MWAPGAGSLQLGSPTDVRLARACAAPGKNHGAPENSRHLPRLPLSGTFCRPQVRSLRAWAATAGAPLLTSNVIPCGHLDVQHSSVVLVPDTISIPVVDLLAICLCWLVGLGRQAKSAACVSRLLQATPVLFLSRSTLSRHWGSCQKQRYTPGFWYSRPGPVILPQTLLVAVVLRLDAYQAPLHSPCSVAPGTRWTWTWRQSQVTLVAARLNPMSRACCTGLQVHLMAKPSGQSKPEAQPTRLATAGGNVR